MDEGNPMKSFKEVGDKRIQEVAEGVKCSHWAVQHYKLNMRDTGKIKKEVYGKRGRPLLLT
jgi:response regulator of citrate/malate metabolism